MNVMRQSEARLLETIISNQRTLNLRYAHSASIHVAVLIKRGKIIAEATNGFGSRSRGSGYSTSSIHAERNVIKQIGNIHELKGAEMYVVRISRNSTCEGGSQFIGSEPCCQCKVFLEKCMREYGLRNVYYTTTLG
jgi:Cytidine and deoxycytidylate deaminase zinc-binding region